MPPEICPHCGTLVPPKARSCPECGSDEETGWSDRAQAQRLGLPDDEFNHDEFAKEEFGETRRLNQIKPHGMKWVWWIVAVILLGLIVLMFL